MKQVKDLFSGRRIFLLILLSISVVYGLSFCKRQASYAYWMENRQHYVVEDVTAMSTLDAYYWLRMARELDEGNIGKGKPDATRAYPDLAPLAIKDTPSLLAVLISFGNKFTGDYYRAGLSLIPILAGLFVFPLFFYFHKLGFGASAVLGGLVGSFSHAYYNRTMMGRVDTDLLNTFFPLAASCFILPMNKERSRRANVALAAGAGLTMYLFTWWYQQPSFILVYLFFMALHLVIGRVHWKEIVLGLVVFLLFSGPEHVMQIVDSLRTFLWAYVSPPPTGQIVWPDILKVVAEAKNRGIEEKLKMLHGFMPLVGAGFFGLVYLYIRRFKKMVPITPVVLLGAWSLIGPSRFTMYLAPFIGIGAGVLVEWIVSFVGRKKIGMTSPVLPLASISLMLVLFFSTAAHTGFPYDVQESISSSTTRAILDIKKIVPRHSAMFTPFWEYGYPLMEIGEFATYHDGGIQGGMRTTLASKALTSPRQDELVSMLSYLEDYGFKELSTQISQENLSAEKMMERVFGYPGSFKGEDVFILYLEDMIWKIPSMAYFGSWDFDLKKSDSMEYVELHCFAMANNVMKCSDGTVDLNRGVMNDGIVDVPLRSAVFINDGHIVDQKHYDSREGYYLQVLMKAGKIHMILVANERLFQTNFNQQYLLGNYDRRHFEEVYNNYPLARVLKIKTAQDSARALPSSEAGATTGRLAGE